MQLFIFTFLLLQISILTAGINECVFMLIVSEHNPVVANAGFMPPSRFELNGL